MSDSDRSRDGWRRCSSCKDWIGFAAAYVRCNVSTCNRKNTGFVFCSVPCWDAHLPTMNHRQAWAEDDRSPTLVEWTRERQADDDDRPREPRRIVVKHAQGSTAPAAGRNAAPEEILVIASRLKNYIKARSGMSTSDGVLAPLSEILRELCDDAIDEARRNERRTVLERDVPSRR